MDGTEKTVVAILVVLLAFIAILALTSMHYSHTETMKELEQTCERPVSYMSEPEDIYTRVIWRRHF